MTPPGISAGTERAVLDSYAGYVAPGHAAVSQALLDALKTKSDQATGHALMRRIVSEMFTTLESFGSWMYALRNRGDEAPGLLNALMSCQTRQAEAALDEFIACDDPFVYLRLPAPSEFLERLDGHHATHGLLVHDVIDGLDEIRSWSKDAAGMRRAADGKVLKFYNKSRHGLPFALLPDADAWTMYLADADEGLLPYEFKWQALEVLHHNTAVTGSRIGSLAAYAMVLNDLELLYPNAADEEE